MEENMHFLDYLECMWNGLILTAMSMFVLVGCMFYCYAQEDENNQEWVLLQDKIKKKSFKKQWHFVKENLKKKKQLLAKVSVAFFVVYFIVLWYLMY